MNNVLRKKNQININFVIPGFRKNSGNNVW